MWVDTMCFVRQITVTGAEIDRLARELFVADGGSQAGWRGLDHTTHHAYLMLACTRLAQEKVQP